MTPIQEINMQAEIFEMAALIVVLFGVAVEFYQLIKEPQEKYWLAANLLWMIHVAIFYIILTIDRYTVIEVKPLFGSYSVWSSVVRLHVVTTVVVLEWYRVRQRSLRNLKKDLLQELCIAKYIEKDKKLTEENKKLVDQIKILTENSGGSKDV